MNTPAHPAYRADGPADPVRPAPDPLADETAGLLQGALADAWPAAEPSGALRERLVRRAGASAQASRAMVNVRARDRSVQQPAPGVRVELVYASQAAGALRPGEPLRLSLAVLAPGAVWVLPQEQPSPPGPDGVAGRGRDWLLVRGEASLETEGCPPVTLKLLDHLAQAGADSRAAACLSAGAEGATVLLRERRLGDGGAAAATQASRDEPAAWQDYAPQVRRRVLWQQGGQAAMLWLAEPGATVPHHRHGHDEECLMLRGDLFQDDYLLREGDYQLAPQGSQHRTVSTDTGALIYAHGDLDMQVLPGG